MPYPLDYLEQLYQRYGGRVPSGQAYDPQLIREYANYVRVRNTVPNTRIPNWSMASNTPANMAGTPNLPYVGQPGPQPVPTKTTSVVGPAATNAPAPGNINLGWTGQVYTGMGAPPPAPQGQSAYDPGGSQSAQFTGGPAEYAGGMRLPPWDQAGMLANYYTYTNAAGQQTQTPYWTGRGTNYGLSWQNINPDGGLQGSLNRYGQPLGTEAPFQPTHRRLRSKGNQPGYWQQQKYDLPQYQNPNHGAANEVPQNAAGNNNGGGSGGSGGGGGGSNLYNDLINWRI